jgi:phosphoesterase, MJ0936 family
LKRILFIGDTHIPDRADNVPEAIEDFIQRGRPWEIVIFTGDVTGEDTLSWIHSLGQKLYIVRGNMDYLPLPKTQVFEYEGFKIGVHHGDGFYPRGDKVKLSMIAQKLGVNILVSGHTHSDFIKIGSTGRELLLNPGSLTGVWGGGGGSFTPSFMILEFMDNALAVKTYKLLNNTLQEKITIVKFIEGKWFLEQ